MTAAHIPLYQGRTGVIDYNTKFHENSPVNTNLLAAGEKMLWRMNIFMP
jgi:hypothetical protein